MRVLVITFCLFQSIVLGQVKVSINLPLDSNPVYAFFYESDSNIIYVGIKNQFRVEIPEIKNRNIQLALSNSDVEFNTIWRPIREGYQWNESLAEYTLNTAMNLGAYKPEEKYNSERYIDTNGVYWEKEYSIFTNIAQEINITIYNFTNDTTASLYSSVLFYSNHIPKPNLLYSDINQLLNSKVLIPTIESVFLDKEEWYKINRFTFTVYDKKDKPLFTQTCFGNFLTPEILNSLNNKKLNYIVLTNIKSLKHNYDDMKLLWH